MRARFTSFPSSLKLPEYMSGMHGSQVEVQHSCKNSLSLGPSLPALWHKEAMEWFKEVRAKEELLLKAEGLK